MKPNCSRLGSFSNSPVDRIRERLVKERTAIVNQIRGLLGEYGICYNEKQMKFIKDEFRFIFGADNTGHY
jgi:transposase